AGGNWLKQYDTPSAAISWKLQELSGTPPSGTFTMISGQQNSFNPYSAGNEADLIASFTYNNSTLTDTVRIRVIPGDPDHITIQADTTESGADLTRYEISNNDTSV